ncbi:ATP-binding cassette long-chain fatty acid transporter [Saccharomycopsis crataegensis]|uniref:ATP-binding cassette long-chain fatty acid transporter n=1 Tax=Saccharomycopsis crataegensis TaxID=43959 RepID=A0AAV5QIT4_9ASCO|nr:ATP-binding cassette long-chain fatty acid transporter [Saccharomycopsis crataegensis]
MVILQSSMKSKIHTLLRRLLESNSLFSSRSLLFIFVSSLASSSAYAAIIFIRKLIYHFNEKREYQKLRYYYVLNDKTRSAVDLSIKKNKSLLKSISLVGFNRNDWAATSNNVAVNFKTVYIKQKERIKKILIKRIDNDVFERNTLIFKNFKRSLVNSTNSIINFKFINQLLIIWNILIPNVFNRNSYLLVCQVIFLVVRTYLSVLITKLDGQIVKDIINKNFKNFVADLIYWFIIAFPSSYVNSGIKFFEKRLSLNFRTNLVRYIHDLYLNDRMVFYKINQFGIVETSPSNLKQNDPKVLENIDQFITSDITRLCDSITSLISNLGKPIIDVAIFSMYLRDNLGNGGILGLFANFAISAVYLKLHTPDFGKLTKEMQSIEGEYFNYHSNLINNSEEISFYNGLKVEKEKVTSIFNRLIKHISFVNNVKINYNFLENYILKVIWNSSGYIFAALPILLDSAASSNKSTSIKQFVTNKRLIFSLADSASRLMYSAKDISTLSGYVDRVFNLLSLLHRCHSLEFNFNDQYINDIKGTIQNDYNGLRMEKISIIIPSRQGSYNPKIINKLTFSMKQGENLLILGFNGSGKTSIERVIAGLWPLYRGLLSKPNDKDIIYLPQIPYFLQHGTLRDQIIYPMTEMEFYEQGYVDDDLVEVLRLVKLQYLLTREPNYINATYDWSSVLSGGEKQRINIARVLFKSPTFVILDESTNAISTDIEDYLYDLLKTRGITFITLSHRPLLMKYHDYLIQILNKEGEWKFETLGTSMAIESIENEISSITKVLGEETKLIKRKQEIDLMLENGDDDTDVEESGEIYYDMYN